MNMKVVSMCLICAGALLTGCGNGGKKEAETSERKEKRPWLVVIKTNMVVLLLPDIRGARCRKIASICGRKVSA